jgi:hypothetical protein
MKTHHPNTLNSILFSLISVIMIMLAVFVGISGLLYSSANDTSTRQVLQSTQSHFALDVAGRVEKMTLSLFHLSNNPKLTAEYLGRDRAGLEEAVRETFEVFRTQHHITHLYFTNLDQTVFLRAHKPKRHGDVLSRFTMKRAVANGEVSHGVELGPLGTLTLRVVAPWRVDGTLIGYIELGEELGGLLSTLSDKFIPSLTVAIEKKFLDRKRWEAGMRSIKDKKPWERIERFVLLEQEKTTLDIKSIRNLLDQDAPDRHGDQSRSEFVDVHPKDGSTHRVYIQPLDDAGGRHIGHYIYSLDITKNIESLRDSILIVAAICLALALVISGAFALIVRRLETKTSLAEASRDRALQHLENLVEERLTEL